MFWTMKGHMDQVLLECRQKEKGDEVLVQFWKEHHADVCLMHKKIDMISNKLGIPFFPQGDVVKGYFASATNNGEAGALGSHQIL